MDTQKTGLLPKAVSSSLCPHISPRIADYGHPNSAQTVDDARYVRRESSAKTPGKEDRLNV